MSKRGSKSLQKINQAKDVKSGSFNRYNFKGTKMAFSAEKNINSTYGKEKEIDIESLNFTELVCHCRKLINELGYLMNKPTRGEKIKLVSKSEEDLYKLVLILQSKIDSIKK